MNAKEHEDRFYDMLEMRLNGVTWRVIGERFKLTSRDIFNASIRKRFHRLKGLDAMMGVQVNDVEESAYISDWMRDDPQWMTTKSYEQRRKVMEHDL
jgi:hypothetical protein